jgi:glycosyltransferase involved in cell wall biosynthesis
VESIPAAVRTLIDDLERRKRMAGAAREYIEVRSFEAAFNETWKVYQEKNMA